jgi:hypothetical protein
MGLSYSRAGKAVNPFFALVLGLVCFSSASADIYLGVGTAMRIKGDSSGAGLNTYNSFGLMSGYHVKSWGFAFEVTESHYETGGGSTLVRLVEKEIVVSAQRALYESYWKPYLAAGLLYGLPIVETHFTGQVTANVGNTQYSGMLAAGVQSHLKKSLNFGTELRYFAGISGTQVTRLDHLVKLVYQF